MNDSETKEDLILRLKNKIVRLQKENAALKSPGIKLPDWELSESPNIDLTDAERDLMAKDQLRDREDVREDGYDWIASNNSLVATFWVGGEFQQYDCLILRQRTIQEE